jgi:hypothetical protein
MHSRHEYLKPHPSRAALKAGHGASSTPTSFHHSDELVFIFCMHQPNGKAGLSSGFDQIKVFTDLSQETSRRQSCHHFTTILLQIYGPTPISTRPHTLSTYHGRQLAISSANTVLKIPPLQSGTITNHITQSAHHEAQPRRHTPSDPRRQNHEAARPPPHARSHAPRQAPTFTPSHSWSFIGHGRFRR